MAAREPVPCPRTPLEAGRALRDPAREPCNPPTHAPTTNPAVRAWLRERALGDGQMRAAHALRQAKP
jgi:hypothetical protein